MVCKATTDDVRVLAEFAATLWPGRSADGIEQIFAKQLIEDSEAAFFISYAGDGPIGFALCQLRHEYVEGTETSPVGYLEGIFIREGYRRKGYAAELLVECERWAQLQGCKEFASDCEMKNEGSMRFHRAAGFDEANRIVCYVKKLI